MHRMRNGYYYILNFQTKKEKIIYMENNKFINTDLLSDNDSFVLGTYLSGTMEVVQFIYDNMTDTVNYSNIEQLILMRSDYLPTKDDTYISTLAHCLSFCLQNIKNYNSLYSENINLNNLCEYIKLCTENKEICNFNSLLKYTSLKSIVIKQAEVIISEIEDNSNTVVDFLKENHKIKPDIYIYKIDTITDLLLSFLQAIFLSKKTINECENCYRIFITLKRNDEKYCNYQLIGENENCKTRAFEVHRKTHFANPKIKTLYDRVRNRLYNRMRMAEYSHNEEDYEEKSKNAIKVYNDFLDTYNNFAEKISKFESTEYDLALWLEKQDKI